MGHKTLIVGDVHLGKGLSQGKSLPGHIFNSRILDQILLLDWIFDVSMQKQINNVVFTGDIFEESKPDFVLLQIFIDFLKKFQHSDTEVHIIIGNHDLKRSGKHSYSVLNLVNSLEMDNVFVHQDITTVHYHNISFTLIPFFDRKSLNCDKQQDAIEKIKNILIYEAEEIPNTSTKVIVGHLTIEGSLYVGDEIDDSLNEIFCPLDLFKDYNYVWMGHIHKPQVCSISPHIAHIGSLDISNFDEANHKKILILIDSDDPSNFESIEVPTRKLLSISVEVPKETDETSYVIETLEKETRIANAIVRLKIHIPSTNSQLNRKKIEEKVYALGAHYLCSFSETRLLPTILKKSEEMDSTVKPDKAISTWADNASLSDDEKTEYKTYAFDLLARIN